MRSPTRRRQKVEAERRAPHCAADRKRRRLSKAAGATAVAAEAVESAATEPLTADGEQRRRRGLLVHPALAAAAAAGAAQQTDDPRGVDRCQPAEEAEGRMSHAGAAAGATGARLAGAHASAPLGLRQRQVPFHGQVVAEPTTPAGCGSRRAGAGSGERRSDGGPPADGRRGGGEVLGRSRPGHCCEERRHASGLAPRVGRGAPWNASGCESGSAAARCGGRSCFYGALGPRHQPQPSMQHIVAVRALARSCVIFAHSQHCRVARRQRS
mmetsp:Transcript_82568/g.239034  ORF Transcript_82568/g.239034 Transcript_82568/m.239034 type:complete len:269 (+) Transcript_82568:1496-2302(+)